MWSRQLVGKYHALQHLCMKVNLKAENLSDMGR